MLDVTYISTIIILIAVVYQDFKDRLISAYLLWAAAGLAIGLGLQYCGLQELMINFGSNVAFIALQGLVLYLYFRFVRGISDIQSVLGLGDILFIVLSAVFFSPVNFVLFYVVSLVITIVGALLMALPQRQKTIPLAGFMAAQLVVVMVLQYSHVCVFCKGSLLDIV